MSEPIKSVADKLTEAQREWVLHGPYTHWTLTTRALARKGIKPLVGMLGMNDFGTAVRSYLLSQEAGEGSGG